MGINVQNLNIYIQDCPILNGISFDVPLGDSLFILGPNGSGKTTLVKFLTGLTSENLKAQVDSYKFNGETVLSKEIRERGRKFSYVPQFPEIQDGLTLDKYLELSRYPYWSENNFVDESLKEGIVERLGLKTFLNRDMTTLSGGELKKAMIAGAFYQETPIVILDEPFQALDPKIKAEVASFLEDWKRNKGITYIIVAHDFYYSHLLADHCLFLKRGEVLAFGKAKDVFSVSTLNETFDHHFSVFKDEKGREFYLPGGKK